MKWFEGYFKGVDLVGWLSDVEEHRDYHFKNAVVESDMESFSKYGFDHVRVPVDYCLFEDEDGEAKRIGYAYLKMCLSWCIKYNLNLLISMNNSFGYMVDGETGEVIASELFEDDEIFDRYKKVWSKIADMFSDFPYRVAFEPMSDAYAQINYQKWNSRVTTLVEQIRQTAPENYIVVGGIECEEGINIQKLNIPTDDRIVYSFHCFEVKVFTQKEKYGIKSIPARFLFPAIKAAAQVEVPLYCGEYGAVELNYENYLQTWADDMTGAFELYKIGNSLWYFKRNLDIPSERVLPAMEVRLDEHKRMKAQEERDLLGVF